ncbi:low molecular weight protein-tyrosine-phosphatase [Actinobacillus porcinus]|uniref:low molecular weight protein-tyrosine-phosphatase n=1 Tax=Actinobacillus porcinus TaxID=51048 RepID=UPI0023F4C47B|nr:low molecular weight protein-tyrosine-phosphatase [Actinobacillus porcinus]MDD7545873.1 low molecular weight phosphotyrosine protein phosphatase [Actinobacillus porcinus]MDY5847818.1 low molecular weight protein-tyrosine-phosphatase [Actinobacillus porcinus]
MKKIKILFVCLGNICRSPMAEYLMRDKIAKVGLSELIETDSAGTLGENDGEGMHCGTADVLDRLKIYSNDFVSRKVRSEDVDIFDYIVTMDHQNLRDIEQLFGKREKIFGIASLCPDLAYDHIPDPWYTHRFDETYQLLDICCDALLEKVRGEHKI